jgi:hypothetical protein
VRALLTVEPTFDHLLAMTDAHGTFEHARFAEPRPEHGYCTDDMARVLVVASREPAGSARVDRLIELSLRFLSDAMDPHGKCRNRMDRRGRWLDRPAVEDCWGRSLWGLGTAAARSADTGLRDAATGLFDRAARQRSRWPRAMVFAALGAAEVLAAQPESAPARALLADAADTMVGPSEQAGWLWPEPRLTYANAALPDAMMAAGAALDLPGLSERGLELLGWLLARETAGGHLSVTPDGGRGPGDGSPSFDQQPIEVAALADACARAARRDGGRRWTDGIAHCVGWFQGDNDADAVMWDPRTGGGYDGLEAHGANQNQGTESTLALLSTFQHGRVHLAHPQPAPQ